MKNYSKKMRWKRVLATILTLLMVVVNLNLGQIISVKAATDYVTLYFVDNTADNWVKNDNATMKAIDNSNGHKSYWMTKVNDTLWSVDVPESAYNLTFNRYDSSKTTQWNSWSAGGRDENNAYYALGSEYGYWDNYGANEAYFHQGDIIYLDVSGFTSWENYKASMYINFTGASKLENNGQDVDISTADTSKYNPKGVNTKEEEYIYKYTVSEDDEGATKLRFWRGNSTTLWNCSIILSYEDYTKGLNCVKITGWNDEGSLFKKDIDVNLDADNDSLPDCIEDYFCTDKTKEDTDGDGLDDYTELDTLVLDPTVVDTDGDGINDGDEDVDGDGLSNIEEINIGTNILETDTDADGLNDYDEVKVYNTDPTKVDTDGDVVSDSKEIEIGTNPLVAENSFNVTATSKDEDTVKTSVEVELEGNQVETLSVEKVENTTLFPEEIPGYIGGAYDFSVSGTFDTAKINFEFDQEFLNDESFDPIIYYFNEEEQEFEELNTTVIGNVASAEVTHFSKYILLNRTVYQNSFKWQDVWDTTGYSGVDVVLVIDDSGSMTSNDSSNQRLSVARDLVDNLPQNSKVGVVRFASSTSILTSSLTNDKELAKSFLTTNYFESYGGTYMYTAINSAFSLFESTDDKRLNMMVVLSDGNAFDTSMHSSVVTSANNKKVKIYTVGLGTSSSRYFRDYLEPLANNTGGAFYLSSDASKLEDIYKDINKKIDIETDSDGDGIADYYEDNMVMFNGVTIKLDKNNPDSDGDGLADGEEVKLKYEYNEDKSKVIVTGSLTTNPTMIDSDGDGLYDNKARMAYDGETIAAPKDPEPLVYNGKPGVWDNHVNKLQSANNAPKEYIDEEVDISEIILGDNIPDEVSKFLVKILLKIRDDVNNNEKLIRPAALIIKKFCNTDTQAAIGAFLLNFVYDSEKIAYHSQPDTWQRSFGYNKFYDDVFRIGSYMNYDRADFSANGKKYALWFWKGDYWNLQSGAEIGLYENPTMLSGTYHYDAVDFEVPMTLSLYNYYSKNNIEHVFSWLPTTEQWWITGFNVHFKEPNPNVMVSVGSVDLSSKTSIYEGLKATKKDILNKPTNNKYRLFKNNLLLDDDTKTAWLIW